MYHAPEGDKTWAWNPCMVTSARSVAWGSVMPWPTNVLMSGYTAARTGSMIGDSTTAKDWSLPSGSGSWRISGLALPAGVNSSGAVHRI